MATTGRWTRKTNGRYRLHLASGARIDFDGGLRLKIDSTEATVDYEVYDGDNIVMAPNFTDLLAIESLPRSIVR